MSSDDNEKTLDDELLKLTNKINTISIEIDTFRIWNNEEWNPFVSRIKEEYRVENLSSSLKNSIDQYFDNKYYFIALRLLRYNYNIMSIYLRQLLIDIYKYNYYLERKNKKSNKLINSDIDNYYDNDEKFDSLNERKKNQLREDYLFKKSKYISFWAKTIFNDFGKDYKETKNEIEHLKNHLSISLHNNSVLFFNKKLTDNKKINDLIKNKIDLINKNLMVYNKSSNDYTFLNSDENLEYKKFKDAVSLEFNKLLSSWIESVKADFPEYYEKIVKLNNL